MVIVSRTAIRPHKRIFATLALACLGLAGNFVHLPLFFGFDLVFGNIFVFIALTLLGTASGGIAAFIAASYLIVLRGHPYSMSVAVLEMLAVGLALQRSREQSLPSLVALYWALIGIPLIVASHHFFLDTGWQTSVMIALKQAVNDIFNALLATFLVHFLPIRKWCGGGDQQESVSVKSLQTNLLIGLAFFPAIVLIVLFSWREVEETSLSVKQRLASRSDSVASEIVRWQQQHLAMVTGLAKLAAAGGGPAQASLQHDLLLARDLDPNLAALHIVDAAGKVVMSTDERIRRGELAVNLADRPWFQKVEKTRQPAVSEVQQGRVQGEPAIAIAAPILGPDAFLGEMVAIFRVSRLHSLVAPGEQPEGTRISIVDGSGRIVISSEPSWRPLQPFEQTRGGAILERDGAYYRWRTGTVKAPVQSWSNSLYARHTPLGDGQWTLVMEAPLNPYFDELQQNLLVGFLLTFLLALAAFLIGGRLARKITDPLQHLSESTTLLGRDLAPQMLVPESGLTEIDALVENFARMASALTGSHHELRQAHDEMEERAAERALQLQQETENSKQYALALERLDRQHEQQQIALNQHAIVSVTDAAGNIISVNNKFCTISGYTRQELLGQNHRLLKSGNHPKEFYDELWRTISQGEIWHGLICNRSKDGRPYWVNSSILPFLDADGRPREYVSIRTDVTALVLAKEEIKKSEKNFRAIFDNLQDVFYRTDPEGRIVIISPSVEAVAQYKPEEMIGRPLAAFWLKPSARAALLQKLAAEGGRVVDFAAQAVRKDGQVIWVSANAQFYHDQAGNFAGVEGVFRDIGARVKAEAEILKAKQEAEAANRAKSRFLSNMSHELRTPLNAIMGFSQLLKIDDLTPEQREGVEEIHSAGAHLLQLINEILDLSKVESGSIVLSVEAVNLEQSIEECSATLMPLLQQQNIDLEFEKPEIAPIVAADHTRLKQVLLNLMSNAVKYNRAGGRIAISVSPCGSGFVRVNVSDTGIGIAAENMAKLFTPFNRLGAQYTGVEGTGIGLVIAKNLVELMGGGIGAESEPGVGSTFWIELKLDESRPAAHEEAEQAGEQSVIVDGQEHSILYIEDNPTNMRLVAKVLQRFPQISLHGADNPMLGLELAMNGKPDLILLDINLPGMDGYQVLARLRADAKTRNIPVVAISANATPRDIDKGMAAGFNDYLTKPIDIHRLLAVVDQWALS